MDNGNTTSVYGNATPQPRVNSIAGSDTVNVAPHVFAYNPLYIHLL
jgi:hypothetical protein